MRRRDAGLDDFEDAAGLEDFEKPPRKPRRSMPFLGCLTVLLVLVGVVLAGIVVAVKTPTGCERIASFLESRTGLGLKIAEGRLSLPCDLVLCNVAIKPEQAPEGNFRAREVRLGWRPGGLRLEVVGMELELVRAADGWLPEAFSRVAALRDVRETAGLFDDAPERITVALRDSSIYWRGGEGNAQTFVQGMRFWSGTLDTPSGLLRAYELDAPVVRRADRLDGQSVHRRWVSTPDAPYVELWYKGIWNGDIRRVKDWWSSPEGH